MSEWLTKAEESVLERLLDGPCETGPPPFLNGRVVSNLERYGYVHCKGQPTNRLVTITDAGRQVMGTQ